MDGPWGETQSHEAVVFRGKRAEFLRLLLKGYLLMVPTLGVYRFWLTTNKRRYYWQNTTIGGDALEYTGSARQLLLGFLFALAFFLPVYVGFFVLSTQAGIVTVIGYAVLTALFWFFIGYAQYRGRDFRLSRTLWRGIRFDQKGSALAYATRRFLWSLLVILTLGLAYPFMSANLWRYRYSHTWFGDRQMSFVGTWKTVAGPFYRAYATIVALILLMILVATNGGAGDIVIQFAPLALLTFIGLATPYWRAREASRMFSSIRLGEAAVATRIRFRTLFGQYFGLGSLLLLLLVVGIAIATAIFVAYYRETGEMAVGDLRSLAFTGWGGAAIVVGGYLLGFGAFSLLVEAIIDFGFWKAVARGTTITGLQSLESVHATGEDTALVGEGLADALNVGAF
jgi:uncharacterized membrane protein YjgN (DUF898 family)